MQKGLTKSKKLAIIVKECAFQKRKANLEEKMADADGCSISTYHI